MKTKTNWQTQSLKLPSYLRPRGPGQILYVRRRIPEVLRAAYPARTCERTFSLGTSDVREARARSAAALARIQQEFDEKLAALDLRGASLNPVKRRTLSQAQLAATARYYRHCVLQADEQRRQLGMDDEEFDGLQTSLTAQRAELGRAMGRGRPEPVWPALQVFLRLCGVSYEPHDPDEMKRACGAFLRAVLDTLDTQLGRQCCAPQTPETTRVDHPLRSIVPAPAATLTEGTDWESIFQLWNAYVDDRPISTVIAYRTPWNDLQRFATDRGVDGPGQVTPQLMDEFAQSMRQRLQVSTLNGRLQKIRSIYKIGCGRHKVATNPAEDTLGFKEGRVKKGRKRRLPFDPHDLARLFGTGIFTQHLRSQGQSGEGTYWLPLLLFYTGARPEEVAGLAVHDLIEDPTLGWYFNIVDRPTGEDGGFYDDVRDFDDTLPDMLQVPEAQARTLKNGASVRRVPAAQPLLDAGLLRYVEWLRAKHEVMLFPELRKDCHGKLSGAFGKFFTRYKRLVGINDRRKVLYSFRHTMKDFLESAAVPTKYLQRILGHTSGDGQVTDGYGSDVPFNRVVRYFRLVKFPRIAALPWMPKQGIWRPASNAKIVRSAADDAAN